METAAICNKKGFTLIEFLVALVILMVGLLGLLQTVNFAIVNNMTNQMRQEAITLADERMQVEIAKSYDSIPIAVTNETVQRIVNGSPRNYSIVITNTKPTGRTISVDLRLTWNYKGQQYSHAITSLVSQYQ
jgi:type IV pilus assembly protein PilV